MLRIHVARDTAKDAVEIVPEDKLIHIRPAVTKLMTSVLVDRKVSAYILHVHVYAIRNIVRRM